MLELAESTKASPNNDRAVELVNALGLANGALAVSSKVINEYWDDSYDAAANPDPTRCTLEVELDNGSYLLMDMEREGMDMLGYMIRETSLLDAYGQMAVG